MDTIRDLSSISSYSPTDGDLLVLYELAKDSSITRTQAAQLFKKSPAYFRNTYKKLKDNLLEGVLTTQLKGQSKKSQIEAKIWKKYAVFQILINASKRKTASKLGEELLVLVEKRGLLSIAHELCISLSYLYAYLGHPKYLKYSSKLIYLKKLVHEYEEIKAFNNELVYCLRKNKNIEHLVKQLPKFGALAQTNKQYKFNSIYYNSCYLIHQINNDIEALTASNAAALNYCKTTKQFIPNNALSHFLFLSIPIHIYNQDFAKAELAINSYKENNVHGSNNWNVSLQYIAILGFQSNKPQIAANIFLKYKSTPNLQQTSLNQSRWYIIHAFLYLFYVVDKIDFCPPFKLYEFLNSISHKNNSLVSNRYILELLHLLVSKNHRVYQQRVENIEQYISRNLKGDKNARVKYFIRMLKSVAIGNFHPVRVQAYALKNKRKLQKTPRNLHLIDLEIISFDKLWEIVLLILEKQKDIN